MGVKFGMEEDKVNKAYGILVIIKRTFIHLDMNSLWLPYGIGQTIIFLPCSSSSFFLLFSLPNLSRRRLDVCHTSTHGVALVRI